MRENQTTIDVSIGHAPEKGWEGAKGGGLSEYAYNSTLIKPALESALVQSSSLSARWWDAADHPEWRREKEGNLLLLDRLRAMYRGETRPKIAIALHNNASRNPRYGGFMVIYRQEKDGREDLKSKRLAGLLCNELALALPGMKNRGVQGDQGDWVERNLAFTRWAHAHGTAGVILELGFLTCPGDVEVLRDPSTPAKVAGAVLKAINTYTAERLA